MTDIRLQWFSSSFQSEAYQRLIPENLANQLFGGIGSLLAIHRQFLAELEDQLKTWEFGGGSWNEDIGKVDRLFLTHTLVLSVSMC